MCGIVGHSSFKGNTVDLNTFKILMLQNCITRGDDATGIYSPKNGIVKDNDRCDVFLNRYKDKISPDSVLIGHVRASTVGGNTKDNAHPFNSNNITLVHNGTLVNHWEWCRKYDIPTTTIYVDSDVICNILDKTQDFKKLGEINGAAALLIHDSNNPNNLYAYRNKERPLYHGVDKTGMYISSIKESLESIGCKEIDEFKEDHFYTIIAGKIKSFAKIKSEPFKPVYSISQGNYYSAKKWDNLRHTWLFTDNVIYTHDAKIKYGEWYKCIKTTTENVRSKSNYIVPNRFFIWILDQDGKAKKVDPHCFDINYSFAEEDKFCMILEDLYFTEDKSKAAYLKGNIVKVLDPYDNPGTVLVTDSINRCTVPRASIRRLTYTEIYEVNISLKIDFIKEGLEKANKGRVTPPLINPDPELFNDLPFVPNQPYGMNCMRNWPIDNTEDNMDEGQNDIITGNSVEDVEIIEEEDEQDYFGEIDLKVLIDQDFPYISSALEELDQMAGTLSIFKDAQDASKFSTIMNELKEHVDNCIACYGELAVEQGIFLNDENNKENEEQEIEEHFNYES